jgi:hypothetical protein
MATVANNPQAYEEILRLAAEQESQASQQDNSGGNYEESQDTTRTSSQGGDDPESQPLFDTQPEYDPQTQPEYYLQDPYGNNNNNNQGPGSSSTPESQSRMYIQNVLLTQDNEDEAEQVQTSGMQRPNTLLDRLSNERQHTKRSTWDLVKDQLNDPKCKTIVFHFSGEDDNEVPALHPLTATPAVTSGAYLCRYGLARWMQHNVKRSKPMTPQS